MLSAGGQVPTTIDSTSLGEGLGDGEAEAAVIRDSRYKSTLAAQVDVEHAVIMAREAGSGKRRGMREEREGLSGRSRFPRRFPLPASRGLRKL